MRALFSPTATTVADPTYALDVCIGWVARAWAWPLRPDASKESLADSS
jgi:hypothetical protein